MDTFLLCISTGALVWGLVLRDPVERWAARRAQRRRVLAASVAMSDPAPVERTEPNESFTLLLYGVGAEHEHEITVHHIDEAPAEYRYANKTYARVQQRADGAWEYRR